MIRCREITVSSAPSRRSRNGVQTRTAHPIIPAQAKFVRVVGVWLFKRAVFFAFSLLENQSFLIVVAIPGGSVDRQRCRRSRCMWRQGAACAQQCFSEPKRTREFFLASLIRPPQVFYSFMQGIEQTQPGVDFSDEGAGCSVEPSWTGSPPLAAQNHLFDLQPRDAPPAPAPRGAAAGLHESERLPVRAGPGRLWS